MKSYNLYERNGVDGLILEQIAEKPLLSGNIRLKMKAMTLNYRDQMTIEGLFYDDRSLPFTPVSDGVGEIIEIGDGVTSDLSVGDRVAPIFDQAWLDGDIPELGFSLGGDLDGVLAEEMIVPATAVVKIPNYLNDIEAASLPCAAVTAWNALLTVSPLQQNEYVLIQGTGSVSLFALQFSVALGARPIVFSSSDDKLRRVMEMGAFATINYREHSDWDKKIPSITDNHGIDVTVDVAGGKNLNKSLEVAARGGRISAIGFLDDLSASFSIPVLLLKALTLRGIRVGSRRMFEDMLVFMETHAIRPVIDTVYNFEDAKKAFEQQEAGNPFGKLAIKTT